MKYKVKKKKKDCSGKGLEKRIPSHDYFQPINHSLCLEKTQGPHIPHKSCFYLHLCCFYPILIDMFFDLSQ